MDKNNDTLLDLRRLALQDLILQAKKEHDKPLYRQLKLKLKQIQADTSKEETSTHGNTEQ